MDETITIRSCSMQDAEALVSIGIRTFRDTFDEMNTPANMMMYLNTNFTFKKLLQEIQEQGSVFFMAEQHGEAIGYARMRHAGTPEGITARNPVEIERLYVDRNFIGKRVGYLLMSTCIHYAKENQHDAVWLGVWEFNDRALQFYERWGFQKFGSHIFMLGNDAQTDHLYIKYL